MKVILPDKGKGRRDKAGTEKYHAELRQFSEIIKQLRSRVDFPMSTRGWCYLLEGYGLGKDEFVKIKDIFSICRKAGYLPLDICAEDQKRIAEGVISIDIENVEGFAESWVDYVLYNVPDRYTPVHPCEYQHYYIEMLVEKIDLKGLFAPICQEYNVPITNAAGWSDLNTRAAIMRRFKSWEAEGKQCVLLYCGDHDPGGFIISDKIRKNIGYLEHAVGWECDNLIIDRFGLNESFITENNIAWIENLKTGQEDKDKPQDLNDPNHVDHWKPYVQNYKKQFGARKVEANVMVTVIDAGRELCRKGILKYFNLKEQKLYDERISELRDQARDEIINKIRELK